MDKNLKMFSLVKNLPEVHERRFVQMSFASGELNDVDGPVANVLLKDAFVPLQVEGSNWKHKKQAMKGTA